MFDFFSHLIGGAVGSTVLLSLAVMLCAFLLEDAATVIVGVLAADSIVSVPVAIISLYSGILCGDIVLYSVGWLARTHPKLAHYIDHDFTAPFRSWLESRYMMVIFTGHFVPGLRLTTYIASGFFRFPLSRYIPMAVVSGLLLETVLFTLAYLFGSVSSTWAAEARWGIAAVFVLGLFLLARHNVLMYRAKKNELAAQGTVADTRTP
jgi:membrane protein DedA with SNARE-associated domain